MDGPEETAGLASGRVLPSWTENAAERGRKYESFDIQASVRGRFDGPGA